MPKNGSQKGAIEISTFAGMAIIAAVIVIISAMVVIKYREVLSVTAPVVVITPKLTPSVTPIPNIDISNWKTYNWNNLEFKYPITWEVEKNYYSTPAQQDQGVAPENIGVNIFFPDERLKVNNLITIGGRQISCDPSQKHTECAYIPSIANYIYTDSVNSYIKAIFDQVISSFKVTDNNGTADWKVYLNSVYGFEVKYPNSYSIFQEANQKTGKTIPASFGSKKIFITNDPKMFFCCEPVYLSVEILDTHIVGFEKWINDKKIINSENNYRIKTKGDISFAGEKAYQIQASCGIDSPGNIILVNHGSKTYYIRYDSEECLPLSDQILSTFKFTK